MHSPWICCQLGAREHYAIPRSLHQSRHLHTLYTDTWVTPQSVWYKLSSNRLSSLKDRYHPDLKTDQIQHYTSDSILFEIQHKVQNIEGWNLILQRNQWFQTKILKSLKNLDSQQFRSPPTLFSYSYTALDLFRFAKTEGWQTVLGQIDPGIIESKIVRDECDRHPNLASQYQSPPSAYWERWFEECDLADCIIVNSSWSKQLLIQAGIEGHKIQIIPLVYTPPSNALEFERYYPSQFTVDRPLRVLFLGQVILRKGLAALLDSIALLEGLPVELTIVGKPQISIPEQYKNHPQVRWIQQVPRNQTHIYYRESDVFLFPTLSDGFGLTQLEALAWKLPIIASQHCGEVTQHNHNGLILSQINSYTIFQSIFSCMKNPKQLEHFSSNTSNTLQNFTLDQLQVSLLTLLNY